MKLTEAQRTWLSLLSRVGSVDPNHHAVSAATKAACEKRGWARTVRSEAFNVKVTKITEAGRLALYSVRES